MEFSLEPGAVHSQHVQHLEQTIRFYASLARRMENRALAAELELDAARERLAAVGNRAYEADYHWGKD